MKKKSYLKEEYTTTKELLNDIVRTIRGDKLVFRGVSRKNQILPNIKRVRSSKGQFMDLSKEELKLLFYFRKYSSSLLKGNLDSLDVVAYAQHFGLPTRLLDWTRDPFVALYFAVKRNEKPDDGYYRLYYCEMNNNIVISNLVAKNTHASIGMVEPNFILKYKNFVELLKNKDSFKNALKEQTEELDDILQKPKNNINSNGLVFYDTNFSNQRLIAQEGLFSIPKSLNEVDLMNEIENNTYLCKIKLNGSKRKELLDFLENMNYSDLRLFPDLQNICGHITKKHLRDNNENNHKYASNDYNFLRKEILNDNG